MPKFELSSVVEYGWSDQLSSYHKKRKEKKSGQDLKKKKIDCQSLNQGKTCLCTYSI